MVLILGSLDSSFATSFTQSARLAGIEKRMQPDLLSHRRFVDGRRRGSVSCCPATPLSFFLTRLLSISRFNPHKSFLFVQFFFMYAYKVFGRNLDMVVSYFVSLPPPPCSHVPPLQLGY